MTNRVEFLRDFWRRYYKAHPIETRQAHRRFFVDKESVPLRWPDFPYHREIAFWHYAGDWRGEIVRWLTRMESRHAQ